jgi:hypothetical protein
MHIRINFKKPGAGMYQMLLTWGQKLQFYRGRARRIPKDDESLFNTVPIKYITSIEVPPQPKEETKMENITFTPDKFKKFKEIYESTEDGKTFMFEGKEILKSYAKYMIRYLEMKFREV